MNRRIVGIPALLATGALVLAGCGSVSNEGGSSSTDAGSDTASGAAEAWTSCVPGQDAASVADIEGTGEDTDTEVTIGAFNGWDESFATAHLLQAVLTAEGYQAEVRNFEAAPAFTGTAQGDIDLITDVWMPLTHADYIDQYGDDLVQLGCWYDNAKLTIAVNEDSPAQTIGDLAEMGDEYGNKLFGIEAGAGLTKQTREEAIPTYDLDNLDFVVSSTPAMLAEVGSRTSSGENIAVTLWRPHWAYSAYPMRDLEDPEGAMGGAGTILSAGRPGFDEDNPKVAQIARNLVMGDEQLADLENLMMSDEHFGGNDHDAAVAQWLEQNPEFVDQLKAGELG